MKTAKQWTKEIEAAAIRESLGDKRGQAEAIIEAVRAEKREAIAAKLRSVDADTMANHSDCSDAYLACADLVERFGQGEG